MWSNKLILLAMLQFRFRIFLQCLFLEIQCFQCRTILSTILSTIVDNIGRLSQPPCARAGAAGVCCQTAWAERCSSTGSGVAISRRPAMSSIFHCYGSQKPTDVSLYVLPDRPFIKCDRPSMQHALPCIQRAGPGIDIQLTALHARAVWHWHPA